MALGEVLIVAPAIGLVETKVFELAGATDKARIPSTAITRVTDASFTIPLPF
jgi:hypothetical protein